jgi:hypothetical protein
MTDDPPIEPTPPLDPAELPAAAQWMLSQAQSAGGPERAAAELRYTPLAEREARIVGGLRANTKLTAGLGPEAAVALSEWGAAMGRHVVAETAGLDDAAAEDVLQARIPAARQLMIHVARATADPPPPGTTPLAEALRLADVVYGRRFAAPQREAVGRALARWAADAGQPAQQIAKLRAFIEGQLRPEGGEDADAASAKTAR